MTSGDGTNAAQTPSADRVLAVVVAHRPGDWFEQTLQSLADQTFTRLDAMVVDTSSPAGSTDEESDGSRHHPSIASRVHAVLPDARVINVEADTFPAGVNAVLDVEHDASHLLIMHDDVALADDALVHLMTESAVSDAAIVGPKLVDWDEPNVLLEVGLGSDKFAHRVSAIEGRELDQEQHDAVADVFAVPSACMLIRAPLFEALGGFDLGIPNNGEDIDFGWRAVVAGARVVVAPDSIVRHREDGINRWGDTTDERLRLRHQVRTVLGGYGTLRLARVVPQMWLLWMVDIFAALVTVRLGRVRDLIAAWTWNYRRLGQARSKRQQLESIRAIDDGELRDYQERGSARVSQFLSTHLVNEDGESSIAAARQSLSTTLAVGATRNALLMLGVLAALLLFGSRRLLDVIPQFGEFAALTDPGDSWSEWWSGWWRNGLGTNAPVPTAYGFLGGLGTIFVGASGLLRQILILGTIPVGLVGMWRLGGITGSRAAQTLGVLLYAFIPVPYNALAAGSWSALAIYAALPWVLAISIRVSGGAPAAHHPDRRALLWAAGRIALVVAIAGMFTPLVIPAVAVVILGVVAGSLIVGSLHGVPRFALVALVGGLGAVALHLPGSAMFLYSDVQWAPIGGAARAGAGPLSVVDLLAFDSGPFTSTLLPFALLAPGVFALILARDWRLVWAVRGWFVAIAGWAVAWAQQWGAFDLALPSADVPLAIAGLGVALAGAMAAPAFERDLGRHRFGWRQIGAGLAALGLAAGGVPLLVASIDGGWNAPERGFGDEYSQLFADDDLPYRVLWLGDAALLPVAGWNLDDDIAFALTENGGPTSRDQVVAPLDNQTRLVLDAVVSAIDGRTGRLGAALAPMGVRYVVQVEADAPAPFSTRSTADEPSTAVVRSGLSQQLDLVRIDGINRAVRLYRNDAWFATRVTIPPASDRITDPAVTEPALLEQLAPNRFAGPYSPGTDVHVATASDRRWRLEIDGQPSVRATGFGWATRFTPTQQGQAELFYRTPGARRASLVIQLVAWALAVALFWFRRVPTAKAHR